MPRQRDYKAEYARRSASAIRERREATAQEKGFATYGKYRGASESITKEYRRMADAGVWDAPIPAAGSAIHDLLLKARAKLDSYSPKTRQQADQKHESLLAKSKEGRALRDQLRSALGWKEGEGWGARYYPAMRALY